MSWAEEMKGQRVLRDLVHRLAPNADVQFGRPSECRYPFTVQRAGKTTLPLIYEEELADLAQPGGGGRKADIEARLKAALE